MSGMDTSIAYDVVLLPDTDRAVAYRKRAADSGCSLMGVTVAAFGAWVPGEATGQFRVGGDILLTDAEGNSNISGADLATAIVDEIETPAHRRQRFTVAY